MRVTNITSKLTLSSQAYSFTVLFSFMCFFALFSQPSFVLFWFCFCPLCVIVKSSSNTKRHVHLQMIHKLTESYDVTGSTIVTTVDKEMIREFLESIIPVYTCARGTCSIVVHTLTSTDVNRKQMVRVTLTYFSYFQH